MKVDGSEISELRSGDSRRVQYPKEALNVKRKKEREKRTIRHSREPRRNPKSRHRAETSESKPPLGEQSWREGNAQNKEYGE